jgi:hypothetical protein
MTNPAQTLRHARWTATIVTALWVAPFARAAPAPYSLPWQLRPAAATTAARVDSSIAMAKPTDTVATMLLGSFKVAPTLAPLLRLGVVTNSPDGADGATVFVNPALGATWAPRIGDDLRLALFLGATVPVGQGGGDTPDAAAAAAVQSGVLARSAMDNAMFAVNYFTVFPGVGLAFVKHGFTAQAETTLLQLTRVRGENNPGSADSSRTNLTAGLHVGYFFATFLSLGADLRHQTWLANDSVPDGAARTHNTTLAIGPRLHFESEAGWFRPGLSYTHPLDDPMSDAGYQIVQIDLPFVFK